MRKQNKIVICEEKIMGNELLITKIRCGECNSEFYIRKVKGIYYYWCKSSYRKTGCNLKSIRKDMLENMILVDINDKYKKIIKNLISIW